MQRIMKGFDFIGDLAPYVLGVGAGILFMIPTYVWVGAVISAGYGAWFVRKLWVDKARGI